MHFQFMLYENGHGLMVIIIIHNYIDVDSVKLRLLATSVSTPVSTVLQHTECES